MNSVIFQETAKLKKPVPAEKVVELSEKLLEPSSNLRRERKILPRASINSEKKFKKLGKFS